jgi:ABC-type phosphate transport system substrate-binding protein
VQDRKRKLGARFGGVLLVAAATSVLALVFAGSGTAGVPPGNGCRADGQIAGAGATLQTRAQVAFIQGYTNDICGFLSGGPAFTNSPANSMVLYNNINDNSQSSWAFTGSGTGQKLVDCRAVPFGGSDIPYDNATLATLDSDPGGLLNGSSQGSPQKYCTGSTSGGPPAQPDIATLLNPFYGATGQYPFKGSPAAPANADQTTNIMSFPVTSTAVMVGEFFGASPAAGCPANGSQPQLTGQQLSDIFGGLDTNWQQIFGTGNCNVPIRRDVRVDKSGTTQNFKNYLQAINGAGALCDGSNWNNYATDANNVNWPKGGTCSPLVVGASSTNLSGNKGVLDTCVGLNSPGGGDPNDPGPVPGTICYADLPDFHGNAAYTGALDEVQLPSGVGGVYQTPENGRRANCDLSGVSTPNGNDTGAVGLAAGDTWSLNNSGIVHGNLGNQGSDYPICAMTWDLVYTGTSTAFGVTAGNPVQNLSNDARRTLYNYVLYMLKDGQTLTTSIFYQSLPQNLLNLEISGFKTNY